MNSLILGTRGSDLALAQSRLVCKALETVHPSLRITQKIITTTGDIRTILPLHEPTAEGSGLFTRQLEESLLKREIDLAVHSLKDLPVETPNGLELSAILPRASVDDLLISRYRGGILGLPRGSVVGSSSPRRSLLLQRRRADVQIMPIRGNVPTRLAKLAKVPQEGAYDATILAAAGLGRLGYDLSSRMLVMDGVTLWLETLDWMLPAPGQGAIAIETRSGDRAVELVKPLHDETTSRCITAERLVLKHLGGGCHLALGAHATESSGTLSLRAVFISDGDAVPRSAYASADTSEEVARRVADKLLFR